MWYKRLLLGLTCALLLCAASLSQALVPAALAQEESPCRTCHEDQYYLFDRGKWQCMCSKQRTCEGCHAGDPSTFDQTLAHAGLTANPITDTPGVCQDCHPADYEARIDQFLLFSGGERARPDRPAPTPYSPAAVGSGSESVHPLLAPEPINPWRAAALGVLVVPFGGLLVFGFRCYQTDCANRNL